MGSTGGDARKARERRTAVNDFARHQPRARGNLSARERPAHAKPPATRQHRADRLLSGLLVAPCSHEVEGDLPSVHAPVGKLDARALRQVRNVVTSADLHFCKGARTSQRNADKGRHMVEVGGQRCTRARTGRGDDAERFSPPVRQNTPVPISQTGTFSAPRRTPPAPVFFH